MKRVSSRQRLVSWDAFDAAVNESGITSDSEISDYETAKQSESDDASFKSRKRERVHRSCKSDCPVIIPSFSWELDSSGTSDLDRLVEDVQLQIVSFLDAKSLRQMMCVNHKYRQLLLSEEADVVWEGQYKKLWNLSSCSDTDRIHLVDSVQLPTAAGKFQSHGANIPLLMSLTPSSLPTKIDESLLRKPTRRGLQDIQLEAFDHEATGRRAIRYNGAIGAGDRCIRSDHPLPKPQYQDLFQNLPIVTNPGFLKLFCRGANAIAGKSFSSWKPFVSPYVDKDNSIQVSPRMTSYFEVSILEDDDSNNEGDGEESSTRVTRGPRAACVAVGIATEIFRMHSRMPGWDSQSFGYHGDDGGIFHSSGGMVKQFGPRFGAGDIVGCGVDYIGKGIFFTLNGKFLGYAWNNVDSELLRKNLYPVIGIDTNNAISVNFGSKSFEYDISSFNQKHAAVITPCYQFPLTLAQLDENLRRSRRRRGQRSKMFSKA